MINLIQLKLIDVECTIESLSTTTTMYHLEIRVMAGSEAKEFNSNVELRDRGTSHPDANTCTIVCCLTGGAEYLFGLSCYEVHVH